MSRLTNRNYIEAFLQLHQLWSDQTDRFRVLTPAEQRYLHDFFRLSENLKASELLTHRREITVRRPSLPQCAGRALAKLNAALTEPVLVPVVAGKRQGKRTVRVTPLVHPTVDVDQMVRALRRAAQDLDEERRDAA